MVTALAYAFSNDNNIKYLCWCDVLDLFRSELFQNRRFPGIVQTKEKKLQFFVIIRLQLAQQRKQTLQKLPLVMWVQISNKSDDNELTIVGENHESLNLRSKIV